MLNVRPRPPKPHAHTKQATTPISKCSQLSHTHAVELATLQRSLLNAVSHLLSPTSLFFSVFLHVFALFFRWLEYPPQRLPTLFHLNSSAILLSHFYLLRIPLIAKKPSRSLTLNVCSSPSFFFFERRIRARGGSSALRPSPCCPSHGVRLPRTSTSLRASCQARSLLAGPRLLPFGWLCQRGVETQAATPSCPITRTPSSRWGCVFASSLSLSHSHSHTPSLALALPPSHSLCATYVTLPPRARTRNSCPLSSLTLSPFLLLLFFVFVFAFSSSSSYLLPLRNSFLLFFFTSASSSLCFSSLLSSSHLFPP